MKDPNFDENVTQLFGAESFWLKLFSAYREAVKVESASFPYADALERAAEIIHGRIIKSNNQAFVFGEPDPESITDAERNAFGFGLILGNVLAFHGIKLSQKTDANDLN
jgi:hypothetical protein